MPADIFYLAIVLNVNNIKKIKNKFLDLFYYIMFEKKDVLL